MKMNMKEFTKNYDFLKTMVQMDLSYINLDCGHNIKDFNEEKLLKEFKKSIRKL